MLEGLKLGYDFSKGPFCSCGPDDCLALLLAHPIDVGDIKAHHVHVIPSSSPALGFPWGARAVGISPFRLVPRISEAVRPLSC